MKRETVTQGSMPGLEVAYITLTTLPWSSSRYMAPAYIQGRMGNSLPMCPKRRNGIGEHLACLYPSRIQIPYEKYIIKDIWLFFRAFASVSYNVWLEQIIYIDWYLNPSVEPGENRGVSSPRTNPNMKTEETWDG